MTTHITKTWFEDGKLITQFFEEKDIYKREWVGLTDDEILNMLEMKEDGTYPNTYDVVKEADAKLKEKNGFAEEKNT